MRGLGEAEALFEYNFNPAEPRDERGRWTRDEAAAAITPVRAGGPSECNENRPERAWEIQPNADFRNRLAAAEGNADKPDYGYGEVNEKGGALGRYQMTPAALKAIGSVLI